MRSLTRTLVALGVAASLACCSTDPAGEDANGGGDVTGGADGVGGDGAGGDGVGPLPGPWDSPAEGNDWRVIFGYWGRVANTPEYGTNELWIMSPTGGDKQAITDLANLANQDPPLSCNHGCFVSPNLKWIAIAEGPPTADGFSFRIGQFTNAALDFKLIKDLVLADKVDFKFAGDRLYFSQKAICSGPSCQYSISFIDLSNPGAITDILTYPLSEDLEQSTYNGHFKVSPDGKKLIMLNTTIRSVQVSLWKDGTGLVQLDFICKFGTQGNCQGTGSEYSDVDPLAISPDGRYAVFFTFSDRWQRARVYDLESPGNVQLAVLGTVPAGPYIEHACDFGVLADWQWERVIGDPVFTPDGEELVFLVETDCKAPNGTEPKKARRNLKRVKLATLLSGKTLVSEDVFDITANPPMGAELGDTRANLLVTGFALSPDGATVVFTGTPLFGQGGDPLADSSSRHRNDREVFRARLDAKDPQWAVPSNVSCERGLCQLTNDVSWEAQSPRVVPPAPF